MDLATRERLNRRALALAVATIAYNALEAIVALTAGAAAGSLALLSFGGDSIVECLSAAVIIWQFLGDPHGREERARRLVGVAFLILAVFVTIGAATSLLTGARPESSPVGIALAIASLIVMPILVVAKRRTGRALGSRSVQADSMQTLLCTGLSAVLLVGLVVNAWLGWWWADPIAALVIAAVAAREGRELVQGEDDCC
jgi:divalent metal cation (Fe/Co/Zn/Cd) transporter